MRDEEAVLKLRVDLEREALGWKQAARSRRTDFENHNRLLMVLFGFVPNSRTRDPRALAVADEVLKRHLERLPLLRRQAVTRLFQLWPVDAWVTPPDLAAALGLTVTELRSEVRAALAQLREHRDAWLLDLAETHPDYPLA